MILAKESITILAPVTLCFFDRVRCHNHENDRLDCFLPCDRDGQHGQLEFRSRV
jgi:hypothetical protein